MENCKHGLGKRLCGICANPLELLADKFDYPYTPEKLGPGHKGNDYGCYPDCRGCKPMGICIECRGRVLVANFGKPRKGICDGHYIKVKDKDFNRMDYDIKINLNDIEPSEKCDEAWDTQYPCDLIKGHTGEHKNEFAR